MTRLAIRLVFQSDWHVGTGTSQNLTVDSAIARDHEGFPMVPAKSLTGVLRHSAERLAEELGTGWDEWVRALFGDQPAMGETSERPRKSALSVRPAFLEFGMRRKLVDARLRGLSTVRSSTALDENGVARDGSLRSIEVAMAGLVLVAEVTLGHLQDDPVAQAFFAASVKLTESLGGGRRRGLGRVHARLGSISDNHWSELEFDYETSLPEEAPSVPEPADLMGQAAKQTVEPRDAEWDMFLITITARLPLLLADARSGNEWTSHDHVPGSNLLPIVARGLEQLRIDAARLIADGHVYVGRGHPSTADGRRSWPAPFVFNEEKGVSGSNWENTLSAEVKQLQVPRPVRRGWVSPDGTERPSVRIQFRSHNSIDDATQRTGDAALYTYRVVAAGQQFVAPLWIRRGVVDPEVLCRELSGQAVVGRSKKDDYGLVDIVVTSEHSSSTTETPTTELRVLCVSDVLLSSPTFEPDATAEALAAAVVSELGLVEHDGETPRGMVRTRRIESWSSSWGLPRPSLTAIAAGSAIAFRVSAELPAPLKPTIWIGERNAEGFGEVAVAPSLLDKDLVAPSGHSSLNVETPTIGVPFAATDTETDDLVARHRLRVARRALQDRVVQLRKVPEVNSSQISSLIDHVRNGGSGLPAHLERNIRKDSERQHLESILRLEFPKEITDLLGRPPSEADKSELLIARLEAIRSRLSREKTDS